MEKRNKELEKKLDKPNDESKKLADLKKENELLKKQLDALKRYAKDMEDQLMKK